jgi:hypothetical protein
MWSGGGGGGSGFAVTCSWSSGGGWGNRESDLSYSDGGCGGVSFTSCNPADTGGCWDELRLTVRDGLGRVAGCDIRVQANY